MKQNMMFKTTVLLPNICMTMGLRFSFSLESFIHLIKSFFRSLSYLKDVYSLGLVYFIKNFFF